MLNLFIIIELLSLFHCSALPNLSTINAAEIDHFRIFYSAYTDTKNFPYVVPLGIIYQKKFEYICSASLLTTNYVLTAAHCLELQTTIYVGLGNERKLTERNFVETKGYRMHENYDPEEYYNMFDIGLVELVNAIDPGSGVTPVKLPSKSDAKQTYMGFKAFASGWGRTKHNLSNIRLKYLNVTIVESKKCPFNITSTDAICGMGANFGRLCHGDSGGPLIIQNEKKQIIQIGVASFGTENCTRGYGTFYSRVTRFLDWIETHSDYKLQ